MLLLYSPLDVDLDLWLTALVDNAVWEVLDILLNILVVVLATNETLDIEDGPMRVGSELVLCGISHKTLIIVPGDPRWSDAVTLIVDQNLDIAALHDTHT